MAKKPSPRVFCLENWSSSLTNTQSVRPLLHYLHDIDGTKHIYEHVLTVGELDALLKKWTQPRYERYSIAYFAFHGTPGTIRIGHRRIKLGDLGDRLEGACKGKTLYFGSCSVLDIPKSEIRDFQKQTKARCVAGYTKDIDWFEGAAWDLLFLEALTYYERIDAVENFLKKRYSQMWKNIGFRLIR